MDENEINWVDRHHGSSCLGPAGPIDQTPAGLEEGWFYSDSHNDLPLLEAVDHPVALDPDAGLAQLARQRQWPVISLRLQMGQPVAA